MEDRCIVCGEIIPEGRQVCPECEFKHKISESLKVLDSIGTMYRTASSTSKAINTAKNALAGQIRLENYIKRLNQPEYTGIVWTKDEVVMLLQELLADRS